MSANHCGSTGGAGWSLGCITTSFAPALPSISPSYTPIVIAAQQNSAQPSQSPIEISPGLGGRQLYSKEQWEAQKTTIYRLYNKENKSYNKVVEILHAEHGFFPTYYLLLLC
jgi:hypothetical protein